MYILYKGTVDIYIGEVGAPVNIIPVDAGSTFGDTALQNNAKRGATVLAQTTCETLILYKNDYDKVIKEGRKLQKNENLKYLNKLPYFEKWRLEVLNDFNDDLESRVLKPRETLYKQGDSAVVFYIVRHGILHMESLLDVDLYYKYPQDKNKWMVTQMTKRVKYKVKELKEGDFFGHDEIIEGTDRNTTVYSLHESKVFYMNLTSFLKHFTPERVEQLKKAFPSINFTEVGQKIIENQEMKKKYANSFFSALQLNYIPHSNRDSHCIGSKIRKLRPWLERAKHNKIGNKKMC